MKHFMKSILQKCYLFVRDMSIFTRLLVSFLFVIILPSMFLINFIYKRVEEEFYTVGISYIYQNLDVAVQKTYDKILSYERVAQTFVEENNFERNLAEPKNRKIIEAAMCEMEEKGVVYNLFIIDNKDYYRPSNEEGKTKGNELVSTQQFRLSEVYKDSMEVNNKINWFNTKNEKNMYYGSEQKNNYMGNYVTMTYKIGNNEEEQSLLVFNIDTQKFSGLANINKLYGQDIFLADSEGILTYLSNDFSYRNYPQDIWPKLLEKKEQIYQQKVDGRDMLFVTKKLGKEDWYVVSILKKENMMRVSYDIRNIILVVVAVTTLISLFICAMVTFSISYPLNRFKKAMSLFAKEDFYIEYKDDGKDQIAEASTIFQGMVKRIRNLAMRQVESQKQVSEEKLKQKEMYVSALQMQINPHFLYNMLDLIRWNTVHLESGNGRISRMMSGYSNLLRYNIKLGEGYATIAEEIEYVEKYMKLLELLYEKKITLQVETGEIELEKYKIGKLFFQPVIENTIIHGKLNELEEPHIWISIYKKEDELYIDILNNGKELDEERAKDVNEQFKEIPEVQSSIGLLNVNQRIKLLFGEAYGLQIGKDHELVRVTMVLPALEGTKGEE